MRKLRLEELGRPLPEEYAIQDKLKVVVVLDNIRSGLNTGSIFRTADGFGIERLILCGITPAPPHKEIHKTAIGAHETVDWSYESNVNDAILSLKQQGYRIVGIEQTTESTRLKEFQFNSGHKWAIVMGNEVEGLSDEILDLLDASIEIEQYGTKHSLNVAVCTGIVLWKVCKDIRSGEQRD